MGFLMRQSSSTGSSACSKLRVGTGFDVHALSPGRAMILGGVRLPLDYGLEGHSDADVLLHAIIDAVLGALSWGDLGNWFPDSDPRYKDASSELLFNEVWKKALSEGWSLVNCDATLIAQKPKLSPYREEIRSRLSSLFGVLPEQISVKATTTERLGFVGREEGVAALATVLLEGCAGRGTLSFC